MVGVGMGWAEAAGGKKICASNSSTARTSGASMIVGYAGSSSHLDRALALRPDPESIPDLWHTLTALHLALGRGEQALADFFNLVPSGGSDWHGAPDGPRRLGIMNVPAEWLERQDEKLASVGAANGTR